MVNGIYLAGPITPVPPYLVCQMSEGIHNTWVVVNIHSEAELYELILATIPYMQGWSYDTYSMKPKPESKYINNEYFSGIPHLIRFDMCVRVVRAMDLNAIDMEARWVQDAAELSQLLEEINEWCQELNPEQGKNAFDEFFSTTNPCAEVPIGMSESTVIADNSE